MSHHSHLLMETPRATLSQTIQWLNVSYSLWFNRRHRRVAHLFPDPDELRRLESPRSCRFRLRRAMYGIWGRVLLRRSIHPPWMVCRARIRVVDRSARRDVGRQRFPVREIIGSLKDVFAGGSMNPHLD